MHIYIIYIPALSSCELKPLHLYCICNIILWVIKVNQQESTARTKLVKRLILYIYIYWFGISLSDILVVIYYIIEMIHKSMILIYKYTYMYDSLYIQILLLK